MMRRRDYDTEGSACQLCKQDRPGDLVHYYAGQHIETKERRAFFSNTTHITSTYQGIQRYNVYVCDACASAMRQQLYLPGAIGWNIAFLVCAAGGLYVYLTKTAGDQMWSLIGCIALFGGLFGLMGVLSLLELFQIDGGSIDDLVVNRLKKDYRRTQDQGDTFFTEAEYRAMFKDAPQGDAALTADELLRRDAGRSDRPRREKPSKEETTKECPHCGGVIPTYAEACKHCKKILEDDY